MITFFKIINLTTAILILFLGLIVLKRNSKSWINISFFILTLFTSIWVFTNFLMFIFQTLFWVRLTYATGSFAMISYPVWAYIFCKGKNKFIFLFYVTGFILFILSLTPLIIKDVVSFVSIGIPVIYGSFFFLFVFYILASYISLLVILFTSYKKTTGVKKNQILFILIGVFLFGISVITFNTILPIFNINSLINLDSPSSLIFVAFNAYAIIKHRFMDIRILVLKSMVYSLIIGIIAGIDALIAYLIIQKYQIAVNQNIFHILVIIIAIFSFNPLKRLFEKYTDRLFAKGRYNPDVLLDEIGDITNSILLLEPLLQSLTYLLYKELRVEKIAILTSEWSENSDENNSKKKCNRCSIGYDKFQIPNSKYQKLVKIINDKNILVYDELKEKDKDKKILRKLDISLIVPLKIENIPIALLVLSNKKSGDAWTSEDIKFLTLISHQIAISIKNAQSYSKMASDKKRIQKLLEERKELDKLKEEFQAIATHEINTPIAATEGYLSMVLEGKTGKISEKSKEFVEQAFQGTKRTHLLIKNLISASQIEHGKISINKLPSNIKRIVSEAFYELKPKADKRNLELILNKSKDSIPKINIDPVLIKEVILNLITNAIKFTKTGQIIVSVHPSSLPCSAKVLRDGEKLQRTGQKPKTKNIVITIEDTGVGMDKKHIPHIFDKFYQIDTSYTREYEGTGLGLYVVKSIIDLHKGKIKVQSQPNVGSKFEVWLPIKK